MCGIFVEIIAKRAMHGFHYRKFQVGVPTHLNQNVPLPVKVLKMFTYKFLPLSVRTHIGRRPVENLGSTNMDRNAEARDVPRFVFKGIIRGNFENTFMIARMNLNYHCILHEPVHPTECIPTHPSR